jgi:hypothetical protein
VSSIVNRHVGLAARQNGCTTPVGEPLPGILPRIAVEELLVLVDMARDHVEVEPLGRLRLAIHE